MEDVVEGMRRRGTLHTSHSMTMATEAATKLLNRNLANIKIDDSQLEKNLADILDRLAAVEFMQNHIADAEDAGGAPSSAGSAGAGRAGGAGSGDPIERLISSLSDRLGRIEAMVEGGSGGSDEGQGRGSIEGGSGA